MLQSTYCHECLPLNGDINMIKTKELHDITERLPENHNSVSVKTAIVTTCALLCHVIVFTIQ